jgi:hypothetical protein
MVAIDISPDKATLGHPAAAHAAAVIRAAVAARGRAPVSPAHPGAILRGHAGVRAFLAAEAASRLPGR